MLSSLIDLVVADAIKRSKDHVKFIRKISVVLAAEVAVISKLFLEFKMAP